MFIQLLKEKIKTKMQTLFQIGLDFVAKNIHYVDSLEGFPELVGEMLSKRVVSLRTEDINNIVSCYKITEYRRHSSYYQSFYLLHSLPFQVPIKGHSVKSQFIELTKILLMQPSDYC